MNPRTALLIFVLAGAATVQAQQRGTWTLTGSFGKPHGTPTATLLTNNRVLLVGGSGAELYDPERGEWISTGNLITPRSDHIAVRLADGKVLVAGGITDRVLPWYSQENFLTSAEIYDPATGVWSPAGNLSVPRAHHTAHLLADGTVLVIGGFYTKANDWITHGSAELYDPVTGAWSSAGTMHTEHSDHASTLLANGNVLVISGNSGAYCCGLGRSADLYDVTTRTWKRTGLLLAARERPTATLLPNGKVLVAGGGQEFQVSTVDRDTAELYDPATGQWTSAGRMTADRFAHTATLLPSGEVLVAGGGTTEAELYDPLTGRWTETGSMSAPRFYHTATLLANGNVLVAGGYAAAGGSPTTAELYDAASPQLTMNSSSYCVGNSWSLRVSSLSPNSWIRLAGTSIGKRWEIVNWRKTDDTGSYSETGAFTAEAEGAHTLYVEIGGKVSNEVPFNVSRCQIQLNLNLSEYCTGDPWNLKITSDFPNNWMNLSGTTNGIPWEIVNWRRTGIDGSFAEAGTFVPGSEGSHTMRVRIGTAQSNVSAFRVSRCGP